MTVIYEGEPVGYCNIEDVRALGITEEMLSSTEVEVNIVRAFEEINSYLGGSYLLHTVEEYQNGKGMRLLFLRERPVVVLEAVSVRINGEWTDLEIFDPETGSGDVWISSRDGGIIERVDGGIFPSGTASVKVRYAVGYDDSEIPGALRSVNARLAAALSLMRIEGVQNPDGLASIGEGALSVSFGAHSEKSDKLVEGWKDEIKQYRRVSNVSI